LSDLFDTRSDPFELDPNAPLADRMRPRDLSEFIGQEDVVGKGCPLRKMISLGRIPSMILWGPPGSGKTTLAYIIARMTEHRFVPLSAVASSVADVRKVVSAARNTRALEGQGTILFIDEIHRFNKAQQDAFLPYVERGTITLIGATTENPSFEVIGPLLSRCRVFVLGRLSRDDLDRIITRALKDDKRGLSGAVRLDKDAREFLLDFADGDARSALNLLEMASIVAPKGKKSRKISRKLLEQAAQKKMARYDKDREWHYDIISALHKSIRGSDPDAGLYWLARMLEGGEDPLYVARRLIRAASEDIGNADPNALRVAVNAYDACHYLGMPECDLALAQTVIYLATAPKSNSTYAAYLEAAAAAREGGDLPVPLHIRNAPTQLMKGLGYGREYQYPHDAREHFVVEEYLPEELQVRKFYKPGQYGFEKEISKRIEYWQKLRAKLGSPGKKGKEPPENPSI
jgi:putative ATPase